LCTFSKEGVPVENMVEFLQRTERPKDVIDACRYDPAVGFAFANIHDTYDLCVHASCISLNAEQVQDFCLKVVNALGVSGRSQLTIPYATSQLLINVFDMLMGLVQKFINHGWFLHLAFMEDVKGRFDELHNTAIHALTQVGASELPCGKHLLPGDYKDPTRMLRRCASILVQPGPFS
jgi:hypothetical protein